MKHSASDVIIIGGGFSGCCLAVNLVRQSQRALTITIIEPRPVLGQGLAYSTQDPDHRLNAPSFVHTLIAGDLWHFTRWCHAQNLAQSDPQALAEEGLTYQRRADFGRYIEQTLKAHACWPAAGSHQTSATETTGTLTQSTIAHHVDQAVALRVRNDPSLPRYEISTKAGKTLHANLVVIATGNHLPGVPSWIRVKDSEQATDEKHPSNLRHPCVVTNVFDGQSLKAIRPDASVLVVGSGLTALDALSTLIRQGHRGPIEVVSRHGLRPRAPGAMPKVLTLANTPQTWNTLPGSLFLDRIMAPAPAHFADPQLPRRASAWLRILRREIASSAAEGMTWHMPFDALRDAVWQLWPGLPLAEKRRFVRHLRPWYDVHRYRTPPQNDAMVREAEAQGRIRFRRAKVLRATTTETGKVWASLLEHGAQAGIHPDTAPDPLPGTSHGTERSYDTIINCAGLDSAGSLTANPVLADLLKAGVIRPDPCGLGIDVDAHCRALNAAGQAQSSLRVIGPPTLGTFGDPVGAIFIAIQVHRMMPDLLETLA